MEDFPCDVAHAICVSLGFQDIRRLSTVGQSSPLWQLGREIRDDILSAVGDFSGRRFVVESLGELFQTAEIKEKRLVRLMYEHDPRPLSTRFRSLFHPLNIHTTRWWYEAQLHLRAFCISNLRKAGTTPSLVDIVRRGLEHEQVREGSASREQIVYAVLGKVCSAFCEGSKWPDLHHGTEPEINEPIPWEQFKDPGFVNSRDLKCPFARAGATWCEVLRTLLCMLRDENYCLSSLCGCTTITHGSVSGVQWHLKREWCSPMRMMIARWAAERDPLPWEMVSPPSESESETEG